MDEIGHIKYFSTKLVYNFNLNNLLLDSDNSESMYYIYSDMCFCYFFFVWH